MFVPVTPALIAEEQHQVLSESSVHYLRLCEINGPVGERQTSPGKEDKHTLRHWLEGRQKNECRVERCSQAGREAKIAVVNTWLPKPSN